MVRSVSLTTLQASIAQDTDEVYLILLTIDHPDLTTPLRLVNDNVDLSRSGDTFIASGFEIPLPTDTEERIVTIDLLIPLVDRTPVSIIRSISTPPTIAMEVIRFSDPTNPEFGPITFSVLHTDSTLTYMTLTLGFQRNLYEDVFPKDAFGPSNSPGTV